MIPSVNVFRRNGLSIQALPGKQLMIIGPADAGPIATPIAKTRGSDVISTFASGPLVEAACYAIKNYRLQVVCVRVDSSSVSAFSDVTRTTGHGSSVVTVHTGSATSQNAEVIAMIASGGTVGTAGITYRISTDGGDNYGALTPLGTANSIVVPLGDTENLTLSLAAGTLAASEIISLFANVVAAGSFGTLDTSQYPGSTCTAVATVDATTYPDGDYQARWRCVDGGTLGTAGITYQTSTDDGRTWSQVTDLGTAHEITFPDSGGASVTLGSAGQTIAPGAELAVLLNAPMFTAESITAALDAAFRYSGAWEWAAVCGVVTASLAQIIDSAFVQAFLTGKERGWMGGWRMQGRSIVGGPTVSVAESDADYQAAFKTEWNSIALEFGSIWGFDCKVLSAVSGRTYKWSPVVVVAPREASVNPQTDIAQVTLGPLPGVTLEDDNGNTDCHDEQHDPGLDDLRAGVLRTHENETGVYVNNPRMFTAYGGGSSGVTMMPHLEVGNLLARSLRTYFRRRLSADFFANSATGKMRDSDRNALEKGANKAANGAIMSPGYASDQLTTISPDDNLTSIDPVTGTAPPLTVEAEFVTKIYVKTINLTVAMVSQIGAPNG